MNTRNEVETVELSQLFNPKILDTDRYNTKDAFDRDTLIYRYKFSEQMTTELYNFSKLHQYDDRKVFKEYWLIWREENSEMIEIEINRLHDLDYNKDIEDKMFKSARYYFRKKQTVVQEPKERRFYISVQKELLESIDKHILTCINERKLKPSVGFSDFCENNREKLKDEIIRLVNCDMKNNEIMNKIKKTYKNRYFILTKK
jgi:hypothetical protein